jgi:Ni/Co efflux regulator RcnB
MKRTIIFAAALSLLVPATAFAAPPGNSPPMTKPAQDARPVLPPKPDKPAKPDKPPTGGNHHRPHKPGTPNKPGTRPPHKPGTMPPHKPGTRPPHKPGWNHNRPGNGYHKPRPSQYYWRGKWLSRIHAAVFHYPRGYSYRVWYAGNRVPALFLTSAYFYDGFSQLGLETPPPGYRWVRYGPDLLLVDLNTNEVEQVVYGAFY